MKTTMTATEQLNLERCLVAFTVITLFATIGLLWDHGYPSHGYHICPSGFVEKIK